MPQAPRTAHGDNRCAEPIPRRTCGVQDSRWSSDRLPGFHHSRLPPPRSCEGPVYAAGKPLLAGSSFPGPSGLSVISYPWIYNGDLIFSYILGDRKVALQGDVAVILRDRHVRMNAPRANVETFEPDADTELLKGFGVTVVKVLVADEDVIIDRFGLRQVVAKMVRIKGVSTSSAKVSKAPHPRHFRQICSIMPLPPQSQYKPSPAQGHSGGNSCHSTGADSPP